MHVVFFDIDGTLIHTGGAGKDAMLATMRDQFEVKSLDGDVSVLGRSDRGIVRDLFQMHGVEESKQNWERFVSAYLSGLKGNLPLRRGTILPGVEPLLRQLRTQAHVAVGLLTGNIAAGARTKLSYFGLDSYFSFGGYGDLHYERRGIAHEALDAAQRHLDRGLDTEKVWVIGDTPSDIDCARAIGARAIGVTTGSHTAQQLQEHGPDLVLEDLSRPESILDLL